MGREVRRVPLDFDWPINETWNGFLSPESLSGDPCICEGGYSPRARELHNLWYGYLPFDPRSKGSKPHGPDHPVIRAQAERNIANAPDFYGHGEYAILCEARRLASECYDNHWMYHLSQDEVDILLAEKMPRSLFWRSDSEAKKRVEVNPGPLTAADVNDWSVRAGFLLDGMGSIEEWTLIQAICEREGVPYECTICDGHGSTEAYPGQRADAEAWEATPPPEGGGWQLWETVSDGSPISPVFDSADGLARWMASPAYKWGASSPLTYESARKFVEVGRAPSGVGVGGRFMDGVAAVGEGVI